LQTVAYHAGTWCETLKEFFTVKQKRNRTVVDKRHFHVCLKNSGRHTDALLPDSGDELIIKGLRCFRRGSISEGRAPPSAAVGKQRKL
jgi:hypothetical protein